MSTEIQKISSRSRHNTSARVNLRVQPQVKRMLVRAAKAQHVKLTEFMIKASQAAAESVLADRTRFVLPPDKWREFNEALDASPKDIPALRKLFGGPSVFKAA